MRPITTLRKLFLFRSARRPHINVPEQLVTQSHDDTRLQQENSIVEKKNNEKRQVLVLIISKLVSAIDVETDKLRVVCDPYKASVSRYNQLHHELNSERSSSISAEKFSHYRTTYITEYENVPTGICMLCGQMGGCNHGMSGMFGQIERRVPVPTLVQKPVYIPDENRRSGARINCELIQSKLNIEFNNQYPTEPTESIHEKSLIEYKNKLLALCNKINSVNISLIEDYLKEYKRLLCEVSAEMKPNDPKFASQFLPRSQYAQLQVSSLKIRQLARQPTFFASLPEEVLEIIACSTVSSLPTNEMRHVFKVSKR